MDFFLLQLFKYLSWVYAYSEVLCVPLEVLWCHLTLILGAVNCCKLISAENWQNSCQQLSTAVNSFFSSNDHRN